MVATVFSEASLSVPGLAILLLVLAINLCGDWLRDTLEPRMEKGFG